MKKRRFHINGSYYDIPETEVSSFLTDNPHAEEVKNYLVKGTVYNIPVHDVDAFETDMGLKKKEPSISSKRIGGAVSSPIKSQSPDYSFSNIVNAGKPKTELTTIQKPKEEIDFDPQDFILKDIAKKGIKINPQIETGFALADYHQQRNKELDSEEEGFKQQLLNYHQDKNVRHGDMPLPQLAINPAFKKDEDPEVKNLHDKIGEIKTYKNKLNQSIGHAASIYALSKTNNPVDAGRIVRSITGDPSVQQELNYEQKGLPISDAQKFYNEKTGLDALETGLEASHKDKTSPEYLFNKSLLEQQRSTLLERHPEFKRHQISNAIAQQIIKDDKNANRSNLWFTVPKAAKELGLTDEEIRAIDYDDIPVQGALEKTFGGAYNALLGIGAGAARIGGSMLGVDKDKISNFLEEGTAPAQRRFEDVRGVQGSPTIVDTNKESKTYLQNIPNPEKGKYNYTFATVSNAIGEGIGSLYGGFVAPAKVMGLKGTMVLSGYERNYQEARNIIGDSPEDEGKRHLMSLLKGVADYYAFKPLEKVMAPESTKELGGIIKSASSLKNVNKEALTKWYTNVLNGAKNTLVETGKIGAGIEISELAKNIVDNAMGSVEGAKEANSQLADKMVGAVEGLPFSMAIPLGLGEFVKGIRHSSMFRENLYNAGLHPETYKSELPKLVEEGQITEDEAYQREEVVDAMSDIVKSIPDELNLNHNQKVEYALSKIKEIALKAKAESIPDDAVANFYRDKIKAEVDNRTNILNGDKKENEFAPPNTDESLPAQNPPVESGTEVESVPISEKNVGESDVSVSTVPKIGDEVDTPNGKAVIDRIKDNGAVIAKLENGSEILYTPEKWVGKKETTQPTATKDTEVKTIEDAVNKMDEVENYTFQDMVNDVEHLANESGNQKVIKAVEDYRKAQAEDTKLSGRGDMDSAEKQFLESVKSEDKDIKVFRGVGGENVNATYGGISDDGMGIFYTDNKRMANQFAGTEKFNPDKGEYESTKGKGKVEESNISFDRPYVIDRTNEKHNLDEGQDAVQIYFDQIKENGGVEAFKNKLLKEGYDGIILKENNTNYYEDGTYNVYIKFKEKPTPKSEPVPIKDNTETKPVSTEETDYDVSVPLKVKDSFKVKGTIRSITNSESVESRNNRKIYDEIFKGERPEDMSFDDWYDKISEYRDKIGVAQTPKSIDKFNFEQIKKGDIKPAVISPSEVKEIQDKEVIVPEKGGGENVPPVEPPKETVVEGDGKKALGDKGVLNHLVTAKNIPEESRKGFLEKGLKYEPVTHIESEAIAKSVIDEAGIDEAVNLAEASKFEGGINSAIFGDSLNRLAEQESKATTQAEKNEIAKKFAEIGIRYDEWGRKSGRDISQIGHFYKKSPLGIQLMENAKRREDFEQWSKKKEQTWKEFFDEMIKEPEFEKIVKEQVSEQLKKERNAARQERLKKVDKFFDDAKDKFKGGAAYSSIIPPPIITAALEGMKQAYHAGEAVVKIVQDAIDYISKELGHDNWDKEKFAKEWNLKLSDGDKRKPLTDEEVKLKILDRFRNKLKGLSNEQRDEVIKKSFKQIVENGGLDYADFRKIIGEVTGRGELSESEAARLRELVTKTNAVDDAAKKAREDRTEDALLKVRTAQLEASKAQKELNELLSTKVNIAKRLTSIMQLNTLGIPALVNNPIYNIVNQLGLRLPVSVINSLIDAGLVQAAKLTGKKYMPETNIIASQVEFFRKLGLGSKESIEQMISGLNRMDYTQKEIYGQQIRPVKSIMDLSQWAKGKKSLSGKQIADKALQATVGIPAEVVARVLNLGDKPMRFGAEGAQSATFAKALGLKGMDYKLFIEFPKEEAYRSYKQKGFSDSEAAKKAEYVYDTMVKEGQRSTFQQDNLLNDMLNRAVGGEQSGLGSLAKAVVVSPYIKIPANAFWSFYNIINPEIALLQAATYGTKAAMKEYGGAKRFIGDKDNTSSAKDLHEARYWLAHAAVGMATRAAIVALVGAGIFRSGNTEDDTKKEREGEQYYENQGTINITKLGALLSGKNPNDVKGGFTISNRWFGLWGSVGNTIAKKYEDATPEQREQQEGLFNTIFGGMEVDALSELQQGVFANTAATLTAIENNQWNRWGMNTINMFTNIFQPAMFAQKSRAELPYYTKAKADSFWEELKNNMLTRSSWLRKLTGEYPPSKVSIWGDKMTKGDNVAMRMFSMSSNDRDNFAQPLYEDYKKNNDTRFFPSSIKPEIVDNSKHTKLNSQQTEQFETLVGQERKKLVAPYINDMANFEGMNKKYSQLTDEEKIEKLNILYDVGYNSAKEKFLKLHPEFKGEKSSEQKRDEKEERSDNKKVRKAAERRAYSLQ